MVMLLRELFESAKIGKIPITSDFNVPHPCTLPLLAGEGTGEG
jgi:hypothetical protein